VNGKKARLRRRMMVNQPSLKVSQTSSALSRLRKSGLFEADMESWINFFDENPDSATPGFVSFVISQRNLTNSFFQKSSMFSIDAGYPVARPDGNHPAPMNEEIPHKDRYKND
jgi:hypothetical protein